MSSSSIVRTLGYSATSTGFTTSEEWSASSEWQRCWSFRPSRILTPFTNWSACLSVNSRLKNVRYSSAVDVMRRAPSGVGQRQAEAYRTPALMMHWIKFNVVGVVGFALQSAVLFVITHSTYQVGYLAATAIAV